MSFNTSHVTPMKNADGSPNDEEVAFYTPKNQDAKDSRSSFFPLTLCSFVSIVSPDGKDVRNSTLQTDSFDDDVCPICLESLYKACCLHMFSISLIVVDMFWGSGEAALAADLIAA